MAFAVRLLRKDDDRSSFRSGDPDLDRFFAQYASQNQFRHRIASTYVAENTGRIVGYATVTAGVLETATLARLEGRKFPPYPLPLLKLARLASDERERGKGIGKGLLRHVLEIALRMSQQIGCVGVFTEAKTEARSFYEGNEFVHLETIERASKAIEMPTPMFLSLRKIEAALEE